MRNIAEKVQWPGAKPEQIKLQAWIDCKNIKVGMRTKDIFVFGPNDSDNLELPCVVTSVELGAFPDGELTFRCRYTCCTYDDSGEVIATQTTLTGKEEEIAAGDVGIISYFLSEAEAAGFGVDPHDLTAAL